MAEKKQIDSHLNKRSKMSDVKPDDKKVQTNELAEASVKLPCQNYESATPYSVLTNEFIELNQKTTSLPYSVDVDKIAHSEVKLPNVDVSDEQNLDMIDKLGKAAKKQGEVSVKPKEVSLPEISPVVEQIQSKELSDIEILNKMNAFEIPEINDKTIDLKVDLTNILPIEPVQEDKKESSTLEVLNDLQQQEKSNDKKSKNIEKEIKSTSNNLADLLKEFEEESGDLGIG